MATLLSFLPLLLRRRRRAKALEAAANWPIVSARLLKSTIVDKDPLAEEGTAIQTFQMESAFYFTLEGAYFGGHLRSTPLSDSEARRLLRTAAEETPVQVRYNPDDPDQTHTFPADNPNFLFTLWPT